MEIITIYGEICRWKINSEGKIYSLADDSLVYPAEKGWFQIVKSDNRWKLIRMLRESRAEVYPDWIDKER
jgi:hypothetical protein